MEIKKGTEVYIKVIITGKASDNRPEDEKGYKFQTRRGVITLTPMIF